MKEIKKQIIKICEDSSLSKEELIKELERQIALLQPYDHDQRSPHKACDIHDNIELRLVGSGGISNVVERIERSLSKRKLAFIFFQKIMDEQEEEEKRGGKSSQRSKRMEVDDSTSLESMMREIMDFENKSSDSTPNAQVTPETCREQDDENCWRCKYFSKNCSRRKGFN